LSLKLINIFSCGIVEWAKTGEEGLKILIVDDAPTICAIYAELLRNEGFEVESALGTRVSSLSSL